MIICAFIQKLCIDTKGRKVPGSNGPQEQIIKEIGFGKE